MYVDKIFKTNMVYGVQKKSKKKSRYNYIQPLKCKLVVCPYKKSTRKLQNFISKCFLPPTFVHEYLQRIITSIINNYIKTID